MQAADRAAAWTNTTLQGCDRPMLTASNIQYELADRMRAIAAGGIGLIHKLVKAIGLDEASTAA